MKACTLHCGDRKETRTMKLFADTADIDEIRDLAGMGIIDGVTTNPTLVARVGRPIRDVIAEICAAVPGPVSAEVTATDFDTMLVQGHKLTEIAGNVVIKVPLTWDGLKACRTLTEHGHKVNVTLCFSANQALLAAKAGATFVSPFIGRLDDAGQDGAELIREIRTIYDNYDHLATEILAASIRTPISVKEVAMAGADVATIPPTVLHRLIKHPLTDIGLAAFLADWKKTGQSIT
jgi:transaldolase